MTTDTSAPPSGAVRFDRDGHVGLVTFDRPEKLNAMTVEMDRRMNEIVYEVNNDDAIRAVVLTGAGDRSFCAGSDITVLDGYGSNWQYRNRTARNEDYAIAVFNIRKPVVAAINGYCIGGGLEMACASDIRIATDQASFAAGEIRWGWHGGSGATQFLTRVAGPGLASKLLLTGERIDAQEALRAGLVQEVVDRDRLMDRACGLAASIASRAPIAAQSAKNLIRVAQSASYDVGMAYENDMFSYCMLTKDAAEGRQAFAEKREGVFHGE
jgi:enoyl-CoA hydratase